MQKLSLLLLLAFGLTILASAQPPSKNLNNKSEQRFTPEQRVEKQVSKLSEQLQLSDTQVEQITQIKSESSRQIEHIKTPYKSILQKMHEEMKTAKENTGQESENDGHTAIKTIREKYKTELEPMHEAIKAVKMSEHKKISALLDDEQTVLFNAMKIERHQNRNGGTHRPR